MHCADAAAADHDVLTLDLMENAGAAAADFGPGLIATACRGSYVLWRWNIVSRVKDRRPLSGVYSAHAMV